MTDTRQNSTESVATRRAPTATGDTGPSAALTLSGISKTYPGVRALTDVSLTVLSGEVHGLVGENGAGKSTLMGVASGTIPPDVGVVRICGEDLHRPIPAIARGLGLAIVHQEPALMADLSVTENLVLGQAPQLRPPWRAAHVWAAETLAEWTVTRHIDPKAVVRDLGPDVRFIIELSKACAQAPSVLVLDEPTEHLTADDVSTLFRRVRELVAGGTAVVYISHHIPEVLDICDRISVLRDGVIRNVLTASETTHDEIVTNIVGRALEAEFPPKRSTDEPLQTPVLSVAGLSGKGFTDITFDVHPGEIVGLAGVEGNGQRELIRAVAGLAPHTGDLRVADTRVRGGSAPAAADRGIVYVPNDRHREGMLTGLGVRENVSVGALGAFARLGIVRTGRERDAAQNQIDQLRISTPTMDTTINSLSGGNQQKAMFGRALQREPKVILADEPTQGVDVGARADIYTLLRSALTSGSGAVVVSSNQAELEGLCDRVLVLSRGRVVRELIGAEVSEQAIVEAALTTTVSREDPVAEGRGPQRLLRFLRGDFAPPVVIAIIAAILCVFTGSKNNYFLTGFAFTGILMLFAALAFASMAQQVVTMVGGIDLSVGPLMGFLTVVASFAMLPAVSGLGIAASFLLLLAIALAVAAVNFAPTVLGIPPLLTTLVAFTALQGLSLLLRPLPGGQFNLDVLDALGGTIGFVPWAAIVAVVAAVMLDVAMRRTTWGVSLRGVGSDEEHARAAGVKVKAVQLSAYLISGLFVFAASTMLMTQVGSGNPTAGITYTLLSITAVVVGGTSINGGRGAFIGALTGAFLIITINSSVTFLNLSTAWQTYMVGILTIFAAGLYSRLRSSNA
jgi:ribose transport system ATP-binding protein